MSFFELNPTPSLKTVSTFSISECLTLGRLSPGSCPPASRENGSNAVLPKEELRPVLGRDLDGFDRRKPCLDQELHFALIAKARQHAAVSSGIRARKEKPSRFDEGAFEGEFF